MGNSKMKTEMQNCYFVKIFMFFSEKRSRILKKTNKKCSEKNHFLKTTKHGSSEF